MNAGDTAAGPVCAGPVCAGPVDVDSTGAGSAGAGSAGADAGASPADLGALLLGQVARLLAGLDGRQVADLVAGRARLTVVTTATARPAGPATDTAGRAASAAGRAQVVEVPGGADLEELRRSLLGAPSRAAAEQLLDDLGPLPVTRLRELAANLGIKGVASRDPRATVQRKIVDQTVGRRLRSAAMSGGVHGT
ncbi:oxidoreductase [Parafrankia discariae]|uniref:oxidoreductase n=1 Tax=Parafrankia discariae TaxID=365528 RepID=UPI001E628D95|nr:oxidoreductase [Parafrankia discariae]